MIDKKMSNALNFPRPFWIVFTGTLFNRFGTFVSVFLVFYMLSRGYSAAQAGTAVGSYGIGGISASVLGGYLADRLGRRNTIILSMFSSAATMLVLSQTTALPLILVLVALAGLTTELYRPASAALITELVPSRQHVKAFALYRLAINLGTTLGPAVAGFLAGRSFFLLFAGDALTSIIFGLLALFGLPSEAHTYTRQQHKQNDFLQTISHDRNFLIFLLATTAIAFIYLQYVSTLALQVQALGLSSAIYGLLVSLNGLTVVLVELPISSITQRFPKQPMIATGFLLIALGFGLFAVASSLPLLALAVILWTLGEIIHSPVSSAYVASLSPPHLRGRYQGAYGMTWSVGGILAPLLGTLIFTWSAAGLWISCALLGIVATILILLIKRPEEAPEQAISVPTATQIVEE